MRPVGSRLTRSLPALLGAAAFILTLPCYGHCDGPGLRPRDCCPLTACGRPQSDVPPAGDRVAVLELVVGLKTSFIAVVAADTGVRVQQVEVAPPYAVRPGLEWRFGRMLFVGLDLEFASLEDQTAAAGKRSITSPGVRARMSFSVWEHLEADALFGAGLAIWSGHGAKTLVGWSRRMSFGGAYEATPGLWVQLHMGTSVAVAGPAGKGPLSVAFAEPQPVGVGGVTLTVGIRSAM